jgi:hypothetical protein
MNCPRCGFNQPDDKYCANCGLDVESYLARPKPFLLRILQNPNLYAFLIGGILVSTAFYIFLNQRTVGRHMSALLRGHFLLSKDAADPKDLQDDSESDETAETDSPPKASAPLTADTSANTAAKEAAPSYSSMEIGFFELSRENLVPLASKILRDDGDWHVVYVDDAKTIESLQSAARKLPGLQEKNLPKENKERFELDAGDVNPDVQSPYLVVGVDWVKNENMHWALDLQLPPPSSSRTLAQAQAEGNANLAGSEPPAATPASPLQLTTLEGNVRFSPQSALLLVYDPALRNFSGLDPASTAKGPLRVLASEDFRAGYSALVVWIRLK